MTKKKSNTKAEAAASPVTVQVPSPQSPAPLPETQPTHEIAFDLFAPRVSHVTLQGSWNNFEDVPMRRADGGHWHITLPLGDGTYQYRFAVTRPPVPEYQESGESVRVYAPDPTSLRIVGTDLDVSEVVVKDGKRVFFEYDWQHDGVPLVSNDKLIIYEMSIADFFTGGPIDPDAAPMGLFQHICEKLDYLVELGVTAVEFMPFTQTDRGDMWGYSPLSPYAVESAFGTSDELAELIDACHARGLRVMQDAVYNHLHENAPLNRIDPSYWFYMQNPDDPDLHFGPKLNYEMHDEALGLFPAREYVLGALERWVSHFHVDGIRFDCTRAIRMHEVLHWFGDETHNRAGMKPFFTVAEHLPQDPSVTGVDGPLDAAWHDSFFAQVRCTVLGIPVNGMEPFNTDAVLRALDARNDGFDSNYNAVRYQNSHDHERTMTMLGSEASVFDEAAFRRCRLGAILTLTAPGITQLWMGEEFGQGTPRGSHKERAPLDWSLLDNTPNQDLFQLYQRLIALRKDCDALTTDTFEPVANLSDRGIIAYKRWTDHGDIVVVVANLRPTYAGEVEIGLPGIADGAWREVVFGYETRSRDRRLTTTLAESEAKVFVYQGVREEEVTNVQHN